MLCRLTDSCTDERFYIEGIKYFTDINIQCATLYQIEIEDSVYALRDKLHAINAPAENFTAVEEATVVRSAAVDIGQTSMLMGTTTCHCRKQPSC